MFSLTLCSNIPLILNFLGEHLGTVKWKDSLSHIEKDPVVSPGSLNLETVLTL